MTPEGSRLSDPVEVATQVDVLSAEFPGHHIAAEHTADHGLRYVARNRRDNVHPRLVVTRDVAELRSALGLPDKEAGRSDR